MKIVLIACEPSGDQIGGELVKSLTEKGFEVYGIGGELMLKNGLKESFFNYRKLAIMGFFEVLPKIFEIKKLMNFAVLEILKINPDIVITIDAPGFNLRLVNALKKAGLQAKFEHVVAPTVWAYKPKRAKIFAHTFNKLFCILPFEPPFFTREKMDAMFIGYPPLQRLQKEIEEATTLSKEYIIFNLGSRKNEILKNLSFAKNVTLEIKSKIPDVKFVFPTFKVFEDEVRKVFANEIIITKESEKNYYKKRALFAISKSGTGAMEQSLFETPSVVFFNANPFSVWLIKKMALIKYFHLVNILLNKMAVPEFLQIKNNPSLLANTVIDLLLNEKKLEAQKQDLKTVKAMLKSDEYFTEIIIKNL